MAMNKQDLLEKLYTEIHDVVIKRQHPVTGLLPASTAVTTHGDYTDAWVRDNVYSIMCVWTLALAFRRDRDEFRADELEQTTVKLMRGLLQSMMRQANKVEKFKHTLHAHDALHAKYDTSTGLPVVADDAWGHLQIDATSIFLLMVGQMSASGIRIIKTAGEVDFIQNLIYYIGAAYRTPDFGIWERGNKINNGKTEINASSVGMAKAALQALDGFNLFGKYASPRGVLHTVPDAVSHARHVLASLLPRESLSKEVDSALLSVIGFPAFAVGSEELVTKTREEILNKLGGNFGCKRFLWDGHQTAVEESSRIYYERSELANFEHIESEWPLFFCYLYLNALFSGDHETAAEYRKKIEGIMIDKDGVGLIPELYFVDDQHVEAERKEPGSQPRVANENLPLVWAQSLYLTGLMLDEGLVTSDDLDPLKMRRRATRFIKAKIALVVLAENEAVKQTLVENGVVAESIGDIAPMRVISAPHLVEVYSQVGANEALGLTGRPMRRLQSLATSQTYEINKEKYLCLSWLQSDVDDYRLRDPLLISNILEREIEHIRKHWINTEVAVFTFMVKSELCSAKNSAELFKTLKALQLKEKNESVSFASSEMAFRASRINELDLPAYCINPAPELVLPPRGVLSEICQSSDISLVNEFNLAFEEDDEKACNVLNELVGSVSAEREISDGERTLTFAQFLEYVHEEAIVKGFWLTARHSFIASGRVHDDLGDSMIALSACHLEVAVGYSRDVEQVISGPQTNDEIVKTIQKIARGPIEFSMLQEMLATMGSYARTNPSLFEGMRTVHLHNMLILSAGTDNKELSHEELMKLGKQSPAHMFEKVRAILENQRNVFDQGVNFVFCQKDMDSESLLTGGDKTAAAIDTDWLEWRIARGMVPRFEVSFLKDIWQSLGHTPRLVFGDSSNQDCAIDTTLTQSSMTPGEESFARYIDQLAQQLHPAFYRSAIIETLYAYTEFCKEQPQSQFEGELVLGAVFEDAAERYVADNDLCTEQDRKIDLFIQQPPYLIQEYITATLQSAAK